LPAVPDTTRGGDADSSRAADPAATLSPEVVAKVARLARLALGDDEVVRMTAQLAGMLAHFHDVDALDLAGVQPMSRPYEMVNVLRDDEPAPSLDRDEVLAAAPDAADGRFRVPPIVGLEG
jgi:aspartyl-tRNA(Asn)/glutamyl-tRNA(Gln) amidotransferase subunit C